MATNKDNVSSVVSEVKETYSRAVAVAPIGATGALRRIDMGGKQDVDKKLEASIKKASRTPMRFRLRKQQG